MKHITIYDIDGKVIAEGEDKSLVVAEAREKHQGVLIGVEVGGNNREKGFYVRTSANLTAAMG
jgi:hypothetical protein